MGQLQNHIIYTYNLKGWDADVLRGMWEKIPDDSKICPYCGKMVSEAKSENAIKQYYVSDKNRIVAILLAMLGFMGIGGLQRIYVAKYATGALYMITGGFFFVGTIWDLYKLLTETFKDGDGYPLYSDSSMKSNYHRRTVKSASTKKAMIAVFFGLLMLMGGLSGVSVSHQKAEQAKQEVVQEKNNIKKEEKKKDETVDENLSKIKIEVQLDDIYIEGKRRFFVDITNTSDYPFKGIVHIGGKGISVLDCIYDLKRLQPGQTQRCVGTGNVSEATKFRQTIQGKFLKITKNQNLNYKVVKQYGGTGMLTYFVCTDDMSDANLTSISQEFCKNYGGSIHDLEVRFVKKQNDPSLDDSLAMYAIHPMNKQLNNKLVWFDDAGNVGRIIATISKE